ncbi:MAG: fumarylacetoacetate hydrolase family protein [Immundisolibacteraceae bacterium]|nr:fumarylacetoacetate hydrolase family protein [Immundisolibacteraceae bacterium]
MAGGTKLAADGSRSELTGLLSADQHQLLAQRLYEAALAGEAQTPLSDQLPELETADSYAIQNLLVGQLGGRRTGFKLGFTSAAMRQQMGIDEANYGVLLAHTQVDQQVSCGRFIDPRLEPEIALVTGLDLLGANTSIEQVANAISRVHPAIEIVDSRFQDYRFRSVDNIADNSSAAGYCLGAGVAPGDIENLEQLECGLYRQGAEIGSGRGEDALGGPLQALQWLVRKLAETDRSLAAGSVILTGGLTRAEVISPGDQFRVEFSGGLGNLELGFVD